MKTNLNNLEVIRKIKQFGKESCRSVWNSKLVQTWKKEYTGPALIEKLKKGRQQVAKGSTKAAKMSFTVLKNVLKFGRKSCKSAWNSKLVQTWKREYTGRPLLEKLKANQNKLILYAAITASTVNTASLNRVLSDKLTGLKVVENRAKKSNASNSKTINLAEAAENKTNSDKKETAPKKTTASKKAVAANKKNTAPKKEKSSEKVQEKSKKLDKDALEQQEIRKHNQKICDEALSEMAAFVVYFENFSDSVYIDSGGTPTIGYGTTIYPDGTLVQVGDLPISRTLSGDLIAEHVDKRLDKDNKQPMYAKARYYAESHLKKRVIPSIVKNVKRKLNRSQAVALSSLVYNIGRGSFAASSFLAEFNSKGNTAAPRISIHNTVKGEWNAGLQVRRGIEYWLFVGKLNPAKFIGFRASGGYDKENLGIMFGKNKLKRSPRAINVPGKDAETLKKFIARQEGTGAKVKSMMDRKTAYKIAENYKLASR